MDGIDGAGCINGKKSSFFPRPLFLCLEGCSAKRDGGLSSETREGQSPTLSKQEKPLSLR